MITSWPLLAREAKFSPDLPHTVTSTKVVTCWRSPSPSLKDSLLGIVTEATGVQRGITDPTLRHIALALRVGVESGDALDRMYGQALSTALAVHLLREYGAAVLGPKRQYGGLPREKLVRADEK
jgi:hypothetical protein